eukprot:IDg4572t1
MPVRAKHPESQPVSIRGRHPSLSSADVYTSRNTAHSREFYGGRLLLVSFLPLERLASLPFTNSILRLQFVRNFERRHRAIFAIGRPLMQESKLFKECSGEDLAIHSANFTCLFEVYKFDVWRVRNCDETGANLERKVTGSSTRRRYFERHSTRDRKIAEFKNAHRVTMLPVMSTAGDIGPSMF